MRRLRLSLLGYVVTRRAEVDQSNLARVRFARESQNVIRHVGAIEERAASGEYATEVRGGLFRLLKESSGHDGFCDQ